MGVQALVGAQAGEFGAVAPQGHGHGTGSGAETGGGPNRDEPALLGNIDPADADENLTHTLPETHLDTTDPGGRT
jgi:hypothetical protein